MDTMDLSQEVVRLQRRLDREKRAREAAEGLLDDYAKKTYLANEKLREAIAHNSAKQAEIEFLVNSTAQFKGSHNKRALVESLLGLCFEFTSAMFATCLLSDEGTFEDPPLTRGQLGELEGALNIASLLPRNADSILNSWCIQELSNLDFPELGNRTIWFVYSNFVYDETRMGWIGLLIEVPTIEEGMLFILDTHITQLRLGLEKLNRNQINEETFEMSNALKKELSQMKKQLTIAERMSSLGQLASGVAHEINNPLAFISANNKFLKKTLSDTFALVRETIGTEGIEHTDLTQFDSKLIRIEENIEEVLQDNQEGIERLSCISDSLRTFVYQGESKPVTVDLNDLVSRAVKVASFSKQMKGELSLTSLNKRALVYGNSGEIEQVILNIIINALHATMNGGDVSVLIVETDETYNVEVRDSGSGISEENLAKIFSPFYTTKPVGEGTGLGLAISRSIIDAHNGSLEVESEINVGSCFSISLPKADKASEQVGK